MDFNEIYPQFEAYVNKIFDENEMPDNTAAYCFNLYEMSGDFYDIQIIAANEFDENNDEWACEEVFSSEDDVLSCYYKTEEFSNWEVFLNFAGNLVEKYLENGKYNDMLKKSQAVAVGFVDGDLNYFHRK